MSTNYNNPHNSLPQRVEEKELENSSQPTSENPTHAIQEIQSIFQETLDNIDREKEDHDNTRFNHGKKNLERETEKPIPEEDEDGFTTPTSLDHRIPAVTHCPPAPAKAKTRWQYSQLKRHASPASRRSLHFDSSMEVESVFFPVIRDNVEEKKTKKARMDDDQEI